VSESVHLVDILLRDEGSLTFVALIKELLEAKLIEKFFVKCKEVVTNLFTEQFAVLIPTLVWGSGNVQHPDLTILSPAKLRLGEDRLLLLNRLYDIASNQVVIGVDS